MKGGKNMEKLTSELFTYLVENDLFTYDELKLLTDINGFSIQTLNSAIFSRYGYRDLPQMKESEEL